MDFFCKECGKRKTGGDEWLLVFKFEKPGTEVKNTIIFADWSAKRALHPRALHFCSLACQNAHVKKRDAREPVTLS